MLQLDFDEKKCSACETLDCLTQCRYMDLDAKAAGKEIQNLINGTDTRVLHNWRKMHH